MDLSRLCAPMVNQSDAPFRYLVRKYGASTVYSQMLHANSIVNDDTYLDSFLPVADWTVFDEEYARPLVVQVCGNDPSVLALAVRRICMTRRVDGIDFNLGCPQDRAREERYGSYLLDKHLWPLVFLCTRAMHETLANFNIPLFCKIRLIDGKYHNLTRTCHN